MLIALWRRASFIVSDVAHSQGIVVEDPAALLLKLGRVARASLTPPIIGISGSAGKTSAKAIAAALNARSSPGNFNTPYALAQVLIDAALEDSTLAPEQRRPLALELGIDHVGEMDILLNLTQPTHGLITSISASHLSALGDVATVAREKGRLLEVAGESWCSESALKKLSPALQMKVKCYGLAENVAPRFDEILKEMVVGEITAVSGMGQRLNVLATSFDLPYMGKAMASNAIGAMALARSLNADLTQAALALGEVKLEPHRLEIRPAKGEFFLLDDSYNSNPASLAALLEVMVALPRPHVLLLGDMLELGQLSQSLHQKMGENLKADKLLTLGPEARHLCLAANIADKKHFEDFDKAAEHLKELVASGLKGTVALKASRGMRFERFLDILEASC
ncbi:MAG: Mur ligase family protein [Deinococcales bacterium]